MYPVQSTHYQSNNAAIRPITTGIVATNKKASISSSPRRIMAITEGRGVAIEIGICIFDMNSCEVIICQLADSQTFSRTIQKINLNDPQEILMPTYTTTVDNDDTSAEDSSKLSQLLKMHFPFISIHSIPRKCFNDEIGKQYICTYGLQEDIPGLLVGVSTKYYCLAAISGVFYYIRENESFTFADHTIKFSYQGVEDTITVKNLELVSNTVNSYTQNTLLHVLDHTVTPMGKRLLRMNILQPPCSLNVIEDRLNAVEQLSSSSEEYLFSIQSYLKQLTDLDYTIAYIIKLPYKNRITKRKQQAIPTVQHSETKVNQLIYLKHAIKIIQAISKTLSKRATVQCSDKENNHNDCLLLDTIYRTSLGIRNQKCYAVKAGVNGLLDVARQTYKETTEDIYELVAQYNETYSLQMKLYFTAANGFYITMPTSQLTSEKGLPPEFINVIRKKKTLQFTTIELLQKNSRINESLTEVYLMSDRIVTELLQKFRENINILYKSSEAIALLDLLLSFASCNLSFDYVRPQFSNTLVVKSGRHPILDRILSFSFVPNDIFASLSSSFQFVTGPNMSGKSTYLRQIALLTIMAQIGSFVPAEYACLRLSDRLLSRLANDNTFSDIGTSSFMSEMRETAYLLQHITNTSIVIIDELGRGTSPNDALGITAAVCEDLIRTKAFCFFATHLHELTCTLNIYPNVVNLHFKVNVTKQGKNDCTVDYQYKIEDGNLNAENHYGNLLLLLLFSLGKLLIYLVFL
ncbi:muts domain V-domain-containing protein [Cokeromyces recurvatus]|uniref:muts domain V-domain-containing protein n=1 Tax=Cokeromyces recurvatus TaxID=90255 RepID=UPI00221E524B|nr:muts domain V-domain-containing protein [Cokeromyces recurvatus]KAI7906727.1 muts domain V-domain-containing protein [Cokeromyces recurvatus]